LLPLPSKEEMRRWEKEEEEVVRNGRSPGNFHVWAEGRDISYISGVYERLERSGTPGKKPPHWGPEQVWQRKICPQAKLRFEQGGRTARTLEELGLVFDPDADAA
jgi:hypothetical protein